MEKNRYSHEDIEAYLDGTHPEPIKFELEMKNNPALSAEIGLQKQIAAAFQDPQKNHLRQVLGSLNAEFAQAEAPKSAMTVHFQTWSRQYLAAAAVLAFAVFGYILLQNPTPDKPTMANTTPTEKPSNPIEAPAPIETPEPKVAPESIAGVKPVEHFATAPQAKPSQKDRKISLENFVLPSEISRGADGAARIEFAADMILTGELANLEEVEVRLVSRHDRNKRVSEQFPLREEKAMGYVKNTPPSKTLEVETSVLLEPGDYDVQIVLPNGEIIFSGKTVVKDGE